MSPPPDIDPYVSLGVAKDATLAEIRAAHRKRVLKCHPDKIQDESQRIAAQDEFQRVQQAYELLSDDARRSKYDQRAAKLEELKRELERKRSDPYASPRGSGSREFRNGHIVEERVPMDVYFEEKMRFTEEPRSMSRKFEEFGMRSKPKAAEEKKRARTPLSTYHLAKEQRETAKATHSDRAKVRDQERRRQTEAKYEVFESYTESDASDSSAQRYVYTKRPTAAPRQERESRSRPSESSRRRERRYDEGDVSDHWQTKFDSQYYTAEDYIASKGRTSRSPRQYRGYDSTEPESSGSKSSGRSTRTRRRSSSRDDPYEHPDIPRTYEAKPPKMQPSATSPGIKSSLRPSFLNTRSATTSGFSRPKRGDSVLHEMSKEPIPSRSSKIRERNDSGYSSPGTPEMLPKSTSAKASVRYKIVTEPDHIVVEPKAPRHRSSRSPERDRPSPLRQPPKRSSTFQTYTTAEASPRAETRSARPSRPHPDVEYITRPKEKDVKYSKMYKHDDVTYSPRHLHHYEDEIRPHVAARRQSAY